MKKLCIPDSACYYEEHEEKTTDIRERIKQEIMSLTDRHAEYVLRQMDENVTEE